VEKNVPYASMQLRDQYQHQVPHRYPHREEMEGQMNVMAVA
jgi:hypothetical protein